MGNIRTELSHPHSYDVELVRDLPGEPTIKQVTLPGGSAQYRLTIRVTPSNGKPWIGNFGGGYDSPQALTAVFSCPDPLSICVIAAGDGFIVRVETLIHGREPRSIPSPMRAQYLTRSC
jgi:hypothetical protein